MATLLLVIIFGHTLRRFKSSVWKVYLTPYLFLFFWAVLAAVGSSCLFVCFSCFFFFFSFFFPIKKGDYVKDDITHTSKTHEKYFFFLFPFFPSHQNTKTFFSSFIKNEFLNNTHTFFEQKKNHMSFPEWGWALVVDLCVANFSLRISQPFLVIRTNSFFFLT